MNLKIFMLVVPLLVLFCLIVSLIKKKNPYDSYIEGVKESFPLIKELLPSLMSMVVAVNVLRVSGVIEDLSLLEDLSERERIEVSTIIQIGNSFDLWSVDFPEKIREERSKSSESDLATFKLTGILRDYCDLAEMVDKQLSISREEKKREYIKTLIRTLTNDIPRLKACIFGAIERSNIPGWNKDEKI